MSLLFHIAQLRHAYSHLIAGNQSERGIASGLIAPAIVEFEKFSDATRSALTAIIDRSHTEELGTSKVRDMREIVVKALEGLK